MVKGGRGSKSLPKRPSITQTFFTMNLNRRVVTQLYATYHLLPQTMIQGEKETWHKLF